MQALAAAVHPAAAHTDGSLAAWGSALSVVIAGVCVYEIAPCAQLAAALWVEWGRWYGAGGH